MSRKEFLTMKVMVLVKATKDSEAGAIPSEQLLLEMGKFNEELVKAGVLLAAEGLHPSSKGARVRFSGKNRTVIEGPFAETQELVAGFWLWKVASLAEAIDWVKRCPNPMPGESEIEIRPVFALEDFGEALTPEVHQQEARIRSELESDTIAPERFEAGRELLIAGFNASYTPESRANIPSQWERFAPHIGRVPGQIGKHTYGVLWNPKSRGFDYLCGVEVRDGAELPAEFSQVRLPAGQYAVFAHREHVSLIARTIGAIQSKWLPSSGFHAGAGSIFERYTEAFDPRTGRGGIEIWVPIRK
jgi:AraC family transcriptional regulator